MMQLTTTLTAPWKQAVSCFSYLGVPDARAMTQLSIRSCHHLLTTQPERLLLLDVRNPEEYTQGALPGSLLVPFPTFHSGAGQVVVQHLIHDYPQRQLIVICAAGVRSAKALAQLQQLGISGWNLQGGLNAWIQEFGALPL